MMHGMMHGMVLHGMDMSWMVYHMMHMVMHVMVDDMMDIVSVHVVHHMMRMVIVRLRTEILIQEVRLLTRHDRNATVVYASCKILDAYPWKLGCLIGAYPENQHQSIFSQARPIDHSKQRLSLRHVHNNGTGAIRGSLIGKSQNIDPIARRFISLHVPPLKNR